MTRKWYAAGVEISTEEKNHIMNGHRDKSIQCGKTISGEPSGSPLAWMTDHFKITDGKLDETDPLLKEMLEVLNLAIEKTFIVQMFPSDTDPLDQYRAGAVYGYW